MPQRDQSPRELELEILSQILDFFIAGFLICILLISEVCLLLQIMQGKFTQLTSNVVVSLYAKMFCV